MTATAPFGSPYPLFTTPRAKIERAKKHIKELAESEKALKDYEPDAYWLEVLSQHPAQKKGPSDSDVLRLLLTPPPLLPAVAGDAIHNLRAALDTLACDLVTANGKSTRDVYFPFCATESELKAAIKERKLNRAKPDAVKILETLQVYPGATLSLRTIHDLDVLDKHRSLIGCVCLMPTVPFRIGRSIIPYNFNIVFHQLGKQLELLNGRAVVSTLESLLQHATGTVEAFAALHAP